jgi:hypothetical protein
VYKEHSNDNNYGNNNNNNNNRLELEYGARKKQIFSTKKGNIFLQKCMTEETAAHKHQECTYV